MGPDQSGGCAWPDENSRSRLAAALDFVSFEFSRLGATLPPGHSWLHEIKTDGYREQVCVGSGRESLHSRYLAGQAVQRVLTVSAIR